MLGHIFTDSVASYGYHGFYLAFYSAVSQRLLERADLSIWT